MEMIIKIQNDKTSKYDKCIVVFNWHNLGEVHNQGCTKKPKKVKKKKQHYGNNLCGVWKPKKIKNER